MVTPLPVDGVDRSHHQDAEANYKAARAVGVRWEIHKATEGNGFVDPEYERRRDRAARAGFPFGAYHFALALGDARTEARHFKSVIGDTDLLPTLDLERVGPPTDHPMQYLTRWTEDFLDEMGEPCLLYTPYKLHDYFGCLLWRPRYNATNTPPLLRWDIFQFSNGQPDHGVPHRVPGFPGATDLNTMRDGLDLDDLMRGNDMSPADFWNHLLDNLVTGGKSKASTLLTRTHKRTADLEVAVGALTAQVELIASTTSLTEQQITDAAEAGAAEALSNLTLTIESGD